MMNHHALQPAVRIGKSGVTEAILRDIRAHLKRSKVIKVKFLRSFLGANDKAQAIAKLAFQTGSKVVHKVGGVVVLQLSDQGQAVAQPPAVAEQ